MFRKSIFIMLFVCLFALSNYALGYNWNTTIVWHNAVGDQDWCNPDNWVHNGGQPDGTIPPDVNTFVVIEPYPGPRIGPGCDATCAALSVAAWSWSNAPDMAVEVDGGTLNAGEAIILCGNDNFSDFDPNAFGSAGLTVRSGTVTTPVRVAGQNGLYIGGGSTTYSLMNRGNVTMYGGLISVPRIALYHGVINLYGGTLECTGDANFIVYQNWPDNKIDIEGGTLIVDGNHINQLNDLYASGRIVAMHGGAVGAPVYNGGTNKTTLTGTSANLNLAWNPVPEMNATNVHYRANDVNTGVLLTWNRGDTNVIQHDVYFGTSAGSLSLAQTFTDANNGDPCSWLIPASTNFKLSTSYYWRVDETRIVSYNYDESGNIISNNTALTTGSVWKFTTHDGKAYNPTPVNAATALSEPLQLSWKAGDFAASTSGHKVYFSTLSSNDLNPNLRKLWTTADPRYRGQQTGTSYPLANLAGAFTIVPGNTYYWCVDEVRDATVWQGPVWSFTAATYVNIDDFDAYSTSLDVNAVWLGTPGSGAYDNSCGTGYGSNSGLNLITTATGKYMRFTYVNSDSSRGVVFSETRRPYAGGTTFTGGGVLSPALAAIRVDYQGAVGNGVDPDYDRMYLALEDTAGNVAIYLNPEASAARSTVWESWFSSLKDVCDAGVPTDVKLSAVTGFCLGFGDRLTCRTSMPPDFFAGDGNVMFDNIRLYAQTCNPTFAHDPAKGGLITDLDNDCDVDINDVDRFANEWLWMAIPEHTIAGITVPHKAPVVWYKFNEGSGTSVVDYGPGAYTVDVLGSVVWSPTGGRNGDACINFNTLPSENTRVEIPVAAFDFMNDAAHFNNTGNGGSVSFSMWINTDFSVGDSMTNNWATVFSVWGTPYGNSGLAWLSLPASYGYPSANFQQHPVPEWTAPGEAAVGTAQMTQSFFGGKWNHWAAVKSEPNALILYCNGKEVARTASAAVAAAPLFKLPIVSFRIGMRGGEWSNWGKWTGKMQDFKVYDYALNANEVAYEATDGTGVVPLVPLVSRANFNLDGGSAGDANQIVNLKDLTKLCQQWRQVVLWP